MVSLTSDGHQVPGRLPQTVPVRPQLTSRGGRCTLTSMTQIILDPGARCSDVVLRASGGYQSKDWRLDHFSWLLVFNAGRSKLIRPSFIRVWHSPCIEPLPFKAILLFPYSWQENLVFADMTCNEMLSMRRGIRVRCQRHGYDQTQVEQPQDSQILLPQATQSSFARRYCSIHSPTSPPTSPSRIHHPLDVHIVYWPNCIRHQVPPHRTSGRQSYAPCLPTTPRHPRPPPLASSPRDPHPHTPSRRFTNPHEMATTCTRPLARCTRPRPPARRAGRARPDRSVRSRGSCGRTERRLLCMRARSHRPPSMLFWRGL